jgi:F-type H+-transporting ATPase subunit epsilon
MTLTVSVITPERSLPAYQADHVTLPAFDGEVGIRTGHAPFVCLLGTGLMRVKNQTQADLVLALKGGVAQVVDNGVKVLAESVAEVERISENDLVTRLQKLNAATYDDPIELTRAKAEAQWYIAQLKMAGKAIPDVGKLGL